MHYSAAWYPELWNDETVAQDIAEMKKVGLNAVRIGEFAWSRMEKREGEIDLSFFRDIITRLHENGIDTILCTPTPTPPIWMTDGHPERLLVNPEGETMHHGARQHVCTNNAHMRRCSDRIVEAMARELGSLPGVIAWQLDNEFKCHVHECVCESCTALWHDWLRKKYGTVQAMNDAWGAQIWSEEYLDFDQVPTPVKTPFLHNSSLSWNYIRFTHDKIAEFAARQTEIIRRYSKAPITHNACPAFGFDHESMFAPLDFVSFDMYPEAVHYDEALMDYDLYRGLKQDGRFWLMETSTGYNGCLISSGSPHLNGYLEAELFAAASAGAETVSYWLWRQQRSGCEQPHGSVLSSWGAPTVGYEPAVRVGQMFGCIGSLLKATKVVPSRVALSYSDEARRMWEVEPMDYAHPVRYYERIKAERNTLSRLDTPVDIVWPSGSLDDCSLLVTAYQPHLTDAVLEKADAFLRRGGVWVVGPLTSFRTGELTVPTDRALSALEARYGFTTRFMLPVHGNGTSVNFNGCSAETELFGCAFEETENVRVLARYEGGVTDGMPAIVEQKVGEGTLILVGAPTVGESGERLRAALYAYAMERAGIVPMYRATPGTVCYLRESPNERYLCCVNMDGKGGAVELCDGWRDICSKDATGLLTLAPYGHAILVEE